jgi:ubiquinone/menaquinone biosynthesis C-methylase UbiE
MPMLSQCRDYNSFLREIHRVLKPGGLMLFGQIEIEVYEYTIPDQVNSEESSTYYPN